jgi:hypothetical protein
VSEAEIQGQLHPAQYFLAWFQFLVPKSHVSFEICSQKIVFVIFLSGLNSILYMPVMRNMCTVSVSQNRTV